MRNKNKANVRKGRDCLEEMKVSGNNDGSLNEDISEFENTVPLDLSCPDPDCQKVNNALEEIIELEDEIKENDGRSPEITAAEILLELRNKYSDFSKNQQHLIKGQQDIEKEKLTLMNLLITDDDLKVFTGINFTLLENLKNAILMCEKKPNQYGLPVKARIVLCLCKLKLNLTFKIVVFINYFDIYFMRHVAQSRRLQT